MNNALQKLVVVIFLLLIIPWIFRDGMFMDGLIYATVAKNLANGQGSWWHLHLTNFLSNSYYDQPPLTIWITSFYFKLFGNTIYTERIYSLTTAIISLLLIRKIWHQIFYKEKEYQTYWWLPVLFWIIPPACFWSYTNNMEENTMSIFIIASIYFLLNGFYLNKNKTTNTILMTLSIFLAFMCKGIQGTFPIAGILFFTLCVTLDNWKTLVKPYIIMSFVIIISIIVLYSYKPSNEYFKNYYFTRLVNTFQNPGASTTENRFYLVYRLLMELLTPLLISILFLAIATVKKLNRKVEHSRIALFFFLLALAGTLPLLITSEQRRFYLVPTFPFYALAFSITILYTIDYFIKKVKTKKLALIVNIVSIITFTSMIILTWTTFNVPKRDAILIHDIKLIGEAIPNGSNISIDPELYSSWSLHLYFQRLYNISLDPNIPAKQVYYLIRKNENQVPLIFSETDLDLIDYKLLRKNE